MKVNFDEIKKFIYVYSEREIKVICKSLVHSRCVSTFMPFTDANRSALVWRHCDLINYIEQVDATTGHDIDKIDIKVTLLAIMQTINQYKLEFGGENLNF